VWAPPSGLCLSSLGCWWAVPQASVKWAAVGTEISCGPVAKAHLRWVRGEGGSCGGAGARDWSDLAGEWGIWPAAFLCSVEKNMDESRRETIWRGMEKGRVRAPLSRPYRCARRCGLWWPRERTRSAAATSSGRTRGSPLFSPAGAESWRRP
jgi:hypothetical protein